MTRFKLAKLFDDPKARTLFILSLLVLSALVAGAPAFRGGW